MTTPVPMVKVWTVSWDDTLGAVEKTGKFKGKIKRRSRDFTGRGAAGRAKKCYNQFKEHNAKISERESLVLNSASR